MTQFYPEPLPVPQGLQTAEFRIRPLTPDHVQLDYDALMSSKTMLRLWGGHSWPSDDFTLADNLKDLAWHAREQRERIAFTYTVLTPAEDLCLGCVYIKPLTGIVAENAGVFTAVAPQDALVRFWVIQTRLAEGLDLRLLEALIQWFNIAWRFSRVVFHTREVNQQQAALLQSRLNFLFPIQISNRGGTHLCFE